jgi:hypothetical protein
VSEFDYDSPDEVSADTIAAVVADMSGKPDKLSDEEREQRQLDHWRFLEQQRVRAEQDRYERNRAKAEADAAQLAQERQTAALERAERNRKLQDQMRRDSDRQMRDRQLSDLHRSSIEQQQFRRGLMRSQANAAAQQSLSDTLDNWWNMKYPPPPPEPTVVVVESDDGSADLGSRNFDVAKWSKKPRSWF